MNKKFLIGILWFSYFIFLYSILKIFFADVYYFYSQKDSNLGYSDKIIYSKKATRLNPNEPAYLLGKARVLLSVNVDLTESDKINALALIDKAISLNDTNVVTLSNSIPLYAYLVDSFDVEYVDKTKIFYNQLKKNYSNDLGILVKIASYERKLGLEDDYEDTLNQIEILRPDILNWHESFR